MWADWQSHRREIGKALKPTTVAYQVKQLTRWHDAGHDPNEIIRTSIANGWTGLFEPKPDSPSNGTGGLVARPAGGGGQPERRTASERRGAFGFQQAAELVERARLLRVGGGADDPAGEC